MGIYQILNWQTLIFLKRLGIFSSSKGRVPQRRAYRITPQLHTSTSGPAYSFPDITYLQKKNVNSDAEIISMIYVKTLFNTSGAA